MTTPLNNPSVSKTATYQKPSLEQLGERNARLKIIESTTSLTLHSIARHETPAATKAFFLSQIIDPKIQNPSPWKNAEGSGSPTVGMAFGPNKRYVREKEREREGGNRVGGIISPRGQAQGQSARRSAGASASTGNVKVKREQKRPAPMDEGGREEGGISRIGMNTSARRKRRSTSGGLESP